MTDQNQALEALSRALQLERDGYAFYVRAADEVRDETCQNTLRSLAEDEKVHEEMLIRQLHALEGQGEYVLLPNVGSTDVDLEARIFAPALPGAAKELGHRPTEIDALHVAMEKEVESYDLYRQSALNTEDPAGRQMYEWLAGAEMTHFNLLMSNYEAIRQSAGWV